VKLRLQLVLLSCTGMLGAALLVEIILRLSLPSAPPLAVQWGMPDDAVEARANEASQESYGSLTFDANGFRIGSGLPYDRTVLFIGDSFTEGHGASDDETFARATERALRRDGLMVRSLNAGHRGFGAAQELKVLRRMLARFPIEAVVVQSFPMNDLSDNLAHGGFGVENGRLIEYETPQPPLRARVTAAIAGSWLQKLYVVRLVANAVSGNQPVPYDSPISFDLERALLDEIVSTVRGRGIPILVLVIPTKLVQWVAAGHRPRTSMELGEIQRFERVRDLITTLGVPSIDAGEVITDLKADAASGDGAHFSRDGNARIGEAIAGRLELLLRAPGGVGATARE